MCHNIVKIKRYAVNHFADKIWNGTIQMFRKKSVRWLDTKAENAAIWNL